MNSASYEPSVPHSISEDAALARLLEEYLTALEAGTSPSRDELVAAHPELAERIDRCLASLRFVEGAANGIEFPAGITSGDDHQPRQLGDFRIRREIGRGGMGIVYEAEQISLSRRVALKVLPFAAVLDERQLQRFRNEAMAAANLDHPHIVDVHGIGCERGIHFYVMRFIPGATLAEAMAAPPGVERTAAVEQETVPIAELVTLRSGRPAAFFRRVAELGIQAAEALEHAHQFGVVHRDIKPSNLLLDHGGKLWITDFGLAQVDSHATLTLPGDVLGTLRYMSPEQAAGRPTMIDHRTDIYSLGATLYELATDRPVVRGQDRAAMLREIAETDPVSPRSLTPGMPLDLETILLKTLTKEPAARYDTAQALADDLRRFLEHQPVQAKRPTWLDRLVKWTTRHRTAACAAGAAALAISLCLIASTAIVWRSLTKQRHATQLALSERNEQRYQRYVADMQLAAHECENGSLAAALSCLGNHLPQNDTPDLRNWEWYFLNAKCHEQFATLSNSKSPLSAAEYCHDGSLLATAGLDGTVRVWNTQTYTDPTILSGCKAAISALSWSPDGDALAASCRDGSVIVWDVQLATVRHVKTVAAATSADCVRWSPDGNQLAAAIELDGSRGALVVWRIGGDDSKVFDDDHVITHVAWLKDSKSIVYATGGLSAGSRFMVVRNVESGDETRRITSERLEVLDLDVSPDGERLVVGGASSEVQIWNLQTGEVLHTILAHQEAVTAVRWNRDRTAIASGGTDGKIHLWNSESGALLRTFNSHEMQVTDLTWSPDGERLVSTSTDRTAKVWDVSQRRVHRLLTGGPTMSLDASGRRLATHILNTNKIELLDLVSGGVLSSLAYPSEGGVAKQLAWSPDQQFLAMSLHTEDEADPEGIVWNVAEKRIVQRLPGGRYLAWSPDGSMIAISMARDSVAPIAERSHVATHEMKVVEFLTGKEVASLSGPPWFCSLAWSPNCKHLAAINTEMRVQLWDTATWRMSRKLTLHPEDPQLQGWSGVGALQWSPNGKQLAAVSSFGRLTVWEAETAVEVLRTQASTTPINGVVWSPDGSRLATVALDGNFRVWDATTGRLLLNRRFFDIEDSNLLWSPHGQEVLVSGARQWIHCLDASSGSPEMNH